MNATPHSISISSLSRQQLAQLGREYMLSTHIGNRVAYAKIRMDQGDNAYLDVAIPHWMGASPVYTGRMQRAMGFANQHDVEAIFKGLQLECGFSHQYFDVNFELESPERGCFWLDSCGPLQEAQPRGPEAVKTMCHDIEDPTFDATAIATNPQARMRPYHRPPEATDTSGPVCKWNVFIDKQAEPLPVPKEALRVAETVLAQIVLEPIAHLNDQDDFDAGGMEDYSGPLHKKLSLEQFSKTALLVICQEMAIQNHLLVQALLMTVSDLYGEEVALAIGEFQMIGGARLTSERLCRLMGLSGGGIDAIAQVLAIHPVFQPMQYSGVQLNRLDSKTLALDIHKGPGLDEINQYSALKLMCAGKDEGLLALLKGIDPTAACYRELACPESDVDGLEVNCRWLITVGSELEEDEPMAVKIGRGAIATNFDFTDQPDIIRMV